MPIRRLDPLVIDRIAAGEVIERPAAAIKELIENALDAGASTIEVAIEAGGRRLIRVVDDGRGMDAADLALSVERHATSKIPDGDLTAIATFGFRGEALPSIASVSRLEIRTRAQGAPTGLKLVVEDGIKSAIEPCAAPLGARVEARDLFAATPARLKFLKSDRAEAAAAADAVKRLAMAAPHARFSFPTDIGSSFDWPAAGAGRSGLCRAAAPGPGRRLRLELDRARRAPRRRAAHRPRRPADLQPAERLPAVPVRQWAGGARQDARRRAARGLPRFPAPRPACGRRPFPRVRPARSRRQRPPGESRSALSRRRGRARALSSERSSSA